jgi:hypothetical protein
MTGWIDGREMELSAMIPSTLDGWVTAVRKAIKEPMEIPMNTADAMESSSCFNLTRGEYHQRCDIIGLVIEGKRLSSVCGFAVAVAIKEEEIGIWEFGTQVVDLVNPHGGGHICRMDKDNCLLGDIDGSGGGVKQFRRHCQVEVFSCKEPEQLFESVISGVLMVRIHSPLSTSWSTVFPFQGSVGASPSERGFVWSCSSVSEKNSVSVVDVIWWGWRVTADGELARIGV